MLDPIFKQVFGEKWNILPVAIQEHYSNRPFSNDFVIAEGQMEIEFGKIFSLIAPLFRICKLLVPFRGKNIFTRVTFQSELSSGALNFKREFFFDEKKPVKFFSKMIVLSGNKIAEVMSCGICWIFYYDFENGLVTLKHCGYGLKLGKSIIPLPITFLFGSGYAEEEAISDDEFRMKMTITHFLCGEIYRYQGYFKIIKKI